MDGVKDVGWVGAATCLVSGVHVVHEEAVVEVEAVADGVLLLRWSTVNGMGGG